MKKILLLFLLLCFLLPQQSADARTFFVGLAHPVDVPAKHFYCCQCPTVTALTDIFCYIGLNWLSINGRGDFNRDGICNFNDFAMLTNYWYQMNNTSNNFLKGK
jgi:hypothetical protein